MKNKYIISSQLFFYLVFFFNTTFSQSSTVDPTKACINCATTINSSAVLEIQSNNKGILIPRMTATQRDAINNPADGLLIFVTDTNTFWFYNGTNWIDFADASGSQGPKGDTGAIGPQGLKGNIGETGVQGPTGDKGEIGVQGPTGAQGLKGDIGVTGAQGPEGVQGSTGDKGEIGAQGPTGAQGLKGDIGVTGPQGPEGVQGPKGDIGATGPQGGIGEQGPPGIAGGQACWDLNGNNMPDVATEDTNEDGNVNILDCVGAQGPEGVQGLKGDTGATGPQGATGQTGSQGPVGSQGLKGDSGATGPQGREGLQGPMGTSGAIGPQGPVGPQGFQGDTGATGPQGPKGDIGPQGPPGTAGGQSCWDLNGNNLPDLEIEDTNGDGSVNILDCRSVNDFGNGNSLFIGLNAGVNNEEGIRNTFVGEETGTQNSSGELNTFVGYHTGYANTSGSENTFIGQGAGEANTTGLANTFMGSSSGETNSTGNYNTFIGREAGKSNTTGSRNTFIGEESGLNLVSGSGNIYIGTQVGASPDLTTPFSEDNTLRIHNGPHPSPLILGDFAERRVTVHGEIVVTEPIRFQPSNSPRNPTKGTMYYDEDSNKLKVWTGGDWEHLTSDSTDRVSESRYNQARESQICKTNCFEELTQKFHQQSILIEQQQDQLSRQQEQLNNLLLLMEELVSTNLSTKKNKTELLLTQAFLAQNKPNPFGGKTSITYVIPDYVQTATIRITSINGATLKIINLEGTGEGELVLHTETYTNGIYYYSLLLDEVVFETKRMIITR